METGLMGKFKIAATFFLLFTLGSSLFTLYAQPPQIEKLFDKAAEEYLAKNWTGAITDLKQVVEMDPGNTRAVALLARAFNSRANQLKVGGKFEDALADANEAVKYSPDFQDALKTQSEIKSAIKKRNAKNLAQQKRRQYATAKAKQEAEARAKMQAEYNKRLEAESSARKARNKKLMEEIQKQKKEVIQRKEEIEILRQQTRIISTRWLIIFTIAVLIIIAAAYLISSKVVSDVASGMRRQLAASDDKMAGLVAETAKKTGAAEGIAELKKANEELLQQLSSVRSNPMEEKLVSQTENLIKVVEQGMGKSDGKTEIVEFDESRPRIVVTDISPANRARAKSIVSISRTINNPPLAARLIAPYLKDGNNRVRATAAAEMFKYDPTAAENTINDMVQSGDKWMRASAAWAIGELCDLSLMNMLEVLIEDFEPLVKERAVASARKAADVLKARFPATLRVKIQRKAG